MYEKQMVKETLEEHLEQDYRLDEPMVESLGRCLDVVIDVIYAKNKDSFQMARNMVLVLHDVLTAKDENEFEGYRRSFGDEQFTVLLELYSLGKTEICCRDILVEMHEAFSGRCSSLAGSYACFHWKQLSSAENDPNAANMLPELREKAKRADETIKNVDDFLAGHSVEDGSAYKLKMMGW